MATGHDGRLIEAASLLLSTLGVALGVRADAVVQELPRVSAADYQRAEKVLDYHLARTVRNSVVAPNWLGNGAVFWYRRETAQGGEFVLVDASTARATTAFDHQRLAKAVSQVSPDAAVSAADLPISSIERNGSELAVELSVGASQTVTCRTKLYDCRVKRDAGPQRADTIASPDGASAVFARNDNLWIVDTATGQERQLTKDGAAYFSYGKLLDGSLMKLHHLRRQFTLPPVGVEWSPDGRTLIGVRADERAVSDYPFVEWVPQDGSFRPIAYNLRLPLLGDKNEPTQEVFAIDVRSGQTQTVALKDGWLLRDAVLDWSRDGTKAFLLVYAFGLKAMALMEVDLRTGAQRIVVQDTTVQTNVMPNSLLDSNSNIRVLADGGEAIWFSERDGWGHLYLYDLRNGQLKNRITSGDWLVRDVVHVDTKRRQIYFTATESEAGRDLYYRHLYRVPFGGGEPTLLTPENAEHEVEPPYSQDVGTFPGQTARGSVFSPDGRYFIDTYSTVSKPAVNVLRRTDSGAVVMQLEQADATDTYAAGWRPPQRFAAKASDGRTDIYGDVYFPPDFRADRKYPVIDAFYGGPQELNAPRSFREAVATSNPTSRSSLAQLGFVVVTIDARGTPGRAKAIHDIGYGSFADPQIEDHIAVIKQLAGRHTNLDLDRVGVYGHSFGGYTSARAILSHPEFYKVAVSSAGSHNYQGFYTETTAFTGVPDYGQGKRFRPTPQAVPTAYAQMDNASFAANLRGHLMLVYGDMDENALPAVTLQLVDSLIKENKTFDLLYLPNRDHSFLRFDAYYTRRMWDYFVLHLLGAQPPENYALKPPARQRCTEVGNVLAAWHGTCSY
jgi:dipeptidyl-peptidase 4